MRLGFVLVCSLAVATACRSKPEGAKHRERSPERDGECRDASMPSAYFYPADDRTHYGPDDPHRDGCALLVADHLFCCPATARPTDR